MKIMFNYIFNFGIKICPKLSIFLIEFTEPKFTFSLTRAHTERLKWRCVKKAGLHACMDVDPTQKVRKARHSAACRYRPLSFLAQHHASVVLIINQIISRQIR